MIEEYLRLLGVPVGSGPSVEQLAALHRAHIERVAYTNLSVLRGEAGGTDRPASVARVLAGGGGYCFQLNGAFSWLLEGLGYRVTMHRGYVADAGAWAAGAHLVGLNHLVLVVHDLPAPDCPAGGWLVDAGLGDAIHAPLPLVEGEHRQGPFAFRLGPATGRAGWRLGHHHAGSFEAMEFETATARLADFDRAHHELSTSPQSSFTGTFTAQRRDAAGIDILRGRHLVRIDAGGRVDRDVTGPDEWSALLESRFGLAPRLTRTLWPRVARAHQDWLARDLAST
jgi:N-hydroxyarylamine O-acetyltransferase